MRHPVFQRRNFRGIRMVPLLWVILLWIPGFGSAQTVSGTLEVHFLNVGQGDAIYIICPTKEHAMLIDAGAKRYTGSIAHFKLSLQNLTDQGSRSIDVAIATHPHDDHIGAMQWVLENYTVSKYLDNGDDYPSNIAEDLRDRVNKEVSDGTLVYESLESAPDKFIDFCPAVNVTATLLRPIHASASCNSSNANNCSVVVRLDYDQTSYLFVGDGEEELEGKLLQDPDTKRQLDVDVLKVGHHGSNTSSTWPFLRAVSPRYAVISVGKKGVATNKAYNHPRLETLNSLNKVLKSKTLRGEVDAYDSENKEWTRKKIKARIYLTVEDGDVVVSTDGKAIWVNTN